MIPVLLSLFLGLVIIGCELMRPKQHGFLDFLRGTSVIYFIAFAVLPIYLQVLSWRDPSLTQSWIFITEMNDSSFVYVGLLALIGYGGIFLGYHLRVGPAPLARLPEVKGPQFSDQYLLALGLFFACIGTSAFLIYASELGGLWHMLKYSGAYRSRLDIKSNYAFLRNIAPLLLIASYLFYGAVRMAKTAGAARVRKILFLYAFLASLLLLYHQAGRLNLLMYMLIFPLVTIVEQNRIRWKTLALGAVLFLAIILFGKELFHIILDPQAVSRKVDALQQGGETKAISYVMFEFAFPALTLANTVGQAVPEVVPYRYFVDFWLALVSLLPNKLLDLESKTTVSMLNTRLFGQEGTIPVDLVSFGYFNLGTIGVLLTTLLFGVLLRLFERLLPTQGGPAVSIFRVAWILFLAFRVMYGDPEIALRPGFYLIFGTLVLYGGWYLLRPVWAPKAA
jgi:hypothetical protein